LLISSTLWISHCDDLWTVKSGSNLSIKEVMIFLRYDQDAGALTGRDKKERQAM